MQQLELAMPEVRVDRERMERLVRADMLREQGEDGGEEVLEVEEEGVSDEDYIDEE